MSDVVQPRREGEDHPLDRLAATVRAVPGVADLYGGVMGEIGTHLPGRRIAGLRRRGERTEITIVAELGRDLHDLAAAVRAAAGAHTSGEVDVTIGDVVFPRVVFPREVFPREVFPREVLPREVLPREPFGSEGRERA